jgi:hypothetical protein
VVRHHRLAAPVNFIGGASHYNHRAVALAVISCDYYGHLGWMSLASDCTRPPYRVVGGPCHGLACVYRKSGCTQATCVEGYRDHTICVRRMKNTAVRIGAEHVMFH